MAKKRIYNVIDSIEDRMNEFIAYSGKHPDYVVLGTQTFRAMVAELAVVDQHLLFREESPATFKHIPIIIINVDICINFATTGFLGAKRIDVKNEQ